MMSLRTGYAWRLALGAVLLLALVFLRPPVASTGPQPDTVLLPDRIAVVPDSPPDSPNFSPWTITAAPIAAVAGEPAPAAAAAQDCTDPIGNGGFESGTFAYWDTSGSPVVLSTGGHSGSHSAQLGGRDNAGDRISQAVACPFSSDQVSAGFYLYIQTTEPGGRSADELYVTVSDGRGHDYTFSYSPLTSPHDTWLYFNILSLEDPAACAPGVTWQFSFEGYTDNIYPTWFLLDDVSIRTCPACTGNGVCLCEDIDYGGACHTWSSDDPELGDDGWHDRASSIQFVGYYAGGRARATLYEHAYYSGASTQFTADDPWLGDDAVGNDSADSIRIEMVPFCDLVSQIPKAECEALVALYNSTFGPYWTDRTGWLVTYTPCSWYGVTCEGGHVTELFIRQNNLTGSIPSSLSNLTNLHWLILDWNGLSGSIPSTLGNLSYLELLYLDGSQLTGPIPSELGKLSGLRWLRLTGNQLTGSIPTSLGDLSNLQDLLLDGNQLTGGIPTSLGKLSNLQVLGVSGNQLTGSIPESLGQLSNLDRLYVNQTTLSGPLPQSLKNLSLAWFYFDNTSLCEPPDAAFQAWLLTINNLQRTNVLCATPTLTATGVPPPATATPTRTATGQPTPTLTRTATGQPTPTRTATGQPTATRTPTATIPGTVRRVYLPLVLKGFWSPRPQDCTELLTNGNFESGGLSNWSLWGDVGLGAGRNSANGGQLGGVNNAEGELWQSVYIPADADAVTWEFWWKAEAASPQPGDNLHVYVESRQVLTTLMLLPAEAPLNEWRHAVLDVSQWAGRWVMVALQVSTDGSVPATFRVDDASMRFCVRP